MPLVKSESRDCQEGARNGNQILEHRNDKVRNLEHPYEPSAYLIPRKRSRDATDGTQGTSDGSRLPPR